MTQAPSTNFATSTTSSVTPVASAPTPLIDIAGRAGPPRAQPVRDHAGLRQREGQERADGEERNQSIGDAAEDDQQERRQDRSRT